MSGLPGRADVVVVGAGFAGAATAYELARAGLAVVVLEREATLGYHASGRNAALCRQLDDDDEVTALCMRGAGLLAAPPAGLAGPLLAAVGSFVVAETEARLERLAAAARRVGLGHERVGCDVVVARWPLLAELPAVGALWIPSDGVIEIRRLLDGLIAGARRHGATVALGVAVTGSVAAPGGVVVMTDRGPIAARAVVNAAGAWASPVGRALGADAAELAIEQRHLFVTAPVTVERAAPLLWFEGDQELYVRTDGDGLLVTACDALPAEPCDATVRPDAERALRDRLDRVAPRLAALPIASSRACLRSFTADRRPRIGWDAAAPGLFWVAGLGGHGATSALAVGERAAAGVLARLG